MKMAMVLAFGLIVLFSGTAYSAEGNYYLDAPGTKCKARNPADEQGLRYTHYGELINVSDEMIKVVCNFELSQKFIESYAIYVFGRGTEAGYGYVECKLWVTNMESASRRSKSDKDSTNETRGYRLMIDNVNSKANTRAPDVVTLECFMDPDTTVQGMRLFQHYNY